MFRKPPPADAADPRAARPEPARPEAAPPDPPPARRFTDKVAQGTVLLAGLRVRGSIAGEDSVEIAGALEGDLQIGGLCQVREGARVAGNIRARQVLIEGEVQGRRIQARERLELRSQARVRADLEAGSVALAEGCQFNGRIQMSDAVTGATTFKEKRAKRSD